MGPNYVPHGPHQIPILEYPFWGVVAESFSNGFHKISSLGLLGQAAWGYRPLGDVGVSYAKILLLESLANVYTKLTQP